MASSEAAALPRLIDYVARPYAPAASTRGKLASTALWDAAAEGRPALLDLKDRLRRGLGPDEVVWGVKEKGGRPYWELYVYNYERASRLSFEAIAKALAPAWRFECPAPPEEHAALLSFELDEASLASRRIDALHLYSITQRESGPTSRSYVWKDGRLASENVYLPMPLDSDAKRRTFDAFASRIAKPESFLPPELMADCRAVCWAFKPNLAGGRVPSAPNSVYLSTLRIDAAISFLERFRYPALAAFSKANRDRLDHLLYDVGYDFGFAPDGTRFPKSGFYGAF